MNEEQQDIQTPNYDGEEMKLPENSAGPNPETTPEKPSVINGPLLAALAAVLIVILTGMYFWLSTMNTPTSVPTPVIDRPTPEANNEPESTTAEAQTESLEVVSTSDEIEAIEADIAATDLESLDAELEAIDAELEAALEES